MKTSKYYRFALIVCGFLMLNACNQKSIEVNEEVPDSPVSVSQEYVDTTTTQQAAQDLSDIRKPNVKVHIKKGMSLLLAEDGVALAAADSVIIHGGTFSITSLMEKDLARMPKSMINVTAGSGAGYRLLPSGEHFKPYAELRMKYDESKIPHGYTAEDIYTSYFDESQHKWTRLYRKEVDTANKEIVSLTSHFTDFVNEVLKSPEMPETQAFTPTMMTDIKAVSPMDGMTMMQPPTANNSGSANLSYPIEIPAGRGGMQPQIGLTYNSNGGSSWIGYGWDIPIPAITLDTRWGVPRYYRGSESEIYLYNGEQLYLVDDNGQPIPLPHRTNTQTPRRAQDTRFFARASDAHDSIIRHGDAPNRYWWEVVDRNGITYYYGHYSDEERNALPSTLTDDNLNIAKWCLTETRDPNGNVVRYYYDRVTSRVGGNPGKQIYLEHINYTGYHDQDGLYNIKFCRVPNYSTDIPTVCNNGFKEVTDQLLAYICLSYGSDTLNAWLFETEHSAKTNNKVRLTSITKIDSVRDGINQLLTSLCACSRGGQSDRDPGGNRGGSSGRNGNNGGINSSAGNGDNDKYNQDDFGFLDTNHIVDESSSSGLTGNGVPMAGLPFGYMGATTTFEYYDAPDLQNMFGSEVVHANLISNPSENGIVGFMSRLRGPSIASTAIGLSHSSSWGIGGKIGIGKGANVCLTTKEGAGSYNYSHSSSESLVSMVDIDGDGLADKLFVRDGQLYYCKQILTRDNDEDAISFDREVAISLHGQGNQTTPATGFLKQNSHTNTFGLQVNFGASGSGSYSTTKSTTTTYLQDVNGDGLVDIVDNGKVYFNKLDNNNRPSFYEYIQSETTTQEVVTSDADCGGIIFDGEVDPKITCVERLVPLSYDTDSCDINDTLHIMDAIRNHYDGRSETFCDSTYVINPDSIVFVVKPIENFPEHAYVLPYYLMLDCRDNLDIPKLEAVKVWVAPKSGNITIRGSVQLKQELSEGRAYSRKADGVIHTIEHASNVQISPENRIIGGNTSLIQSDSIDGDSYTPVNIQSSSFHVSVGDIIFFRLQSGDNKDFDSIKCSYDIAYTDGSFSTNSGSDYVISSSNKFQAPASGRIEISMNGLVPKPNTKYSIFHNNTRIGYFISGYNTSVTISRNLAEGDSILCIAEPISRGSNPTWGNVVWKPSFEFTPSSSSLYDVDSVMSNTPIQSYFPVRIKFDNSAAGYRYDPPVLYKRLFGPLYKGWGQFAYHPDDSYIPTQNIVLEKLIPQDMLVEGSTSSSEARRTYDELDVMNNNSDRHSGAFQNSINDSTITSIDDISDNLSSNNVNTYNPISASSYWVEMIPDFEHYRWISFGGLNLVGKSVMSNDVPNYGNVATTGASTNAPNVPNYDDAVATSQGSTPTKAINKVNRNRTASGSFNEMPFGASGSYSWSSIETDCLDLNGDRYPDIVGEEQVQYSRPWGGIGNRRKLANSVRKGSTTNAVSVGASYSAAGVEHVQSLSFQSRFAKTTIRSKNARMDLSGTGTVGFDFAGGSWIDINGDGLPDYVKRNGTVYLNIGYDFLPKEEWNNTYVRAGISTSASAGVDAVFEDGLTTIRTLTNEVDVIQGSITAGVSTSQSSNQTLVTYIDMNGDGLVDKVFRAFDLNWRDLNAVRNGLLATRIAYNLGNGKWSPSVQIDNLNRFDASFTTNENISAGFTFGFTAFALKFTVGLNGSLPSGSVTQDQVQLVDINADGYPDIITSDCESALTVRYNQMGNVPVNRLKSVTNFTGSSFKIDYALSLPEYEQPSRDWQMVRVETTDTLYPNGPQKSIVEYAYSNPHYDRFERTSYGYGTIVTTEVDVTNNTPYRTVEQNYNNRDYYNKGKLTRTITRDASGRPYVEKIIKNEIVGDPCDNNARANVETITTRYYEGQNTPQLAVKEIFHYDRYHNVDKYEDLGDTNIDSDGLSIQLTYFHDMPNNLIGLRDSIVVNTGANTPTLRSTRYQYHSNGKIGKYIVRNGVNESVSEFNYDAYGNLSEVLLPQNYRGQQMQYLYTYDNILHSYPIEATNSFGETSYSTYDFRRGLLTNSTDISGNSMLYVYDNTGRLLSIKSPLNTSSTPSLVNTYFPINYYHNIGEVASHLYPYSITQHFSDDGSLITESVVITDASGRVIQTKKAATVNGYVKMQVSGRAFTDAFSRVVCQYDPFMENYDAQRGLFNPYYDPLSGTTTEYDVLDRKTIVTDPLHHIVHTDYDITNDAGGTRRFHTKMIDPLSNETHVYCDYENRKVQMTDALGNITKLIYNNIGELSESVDPDTISTLYEYDMMGRMIRRNHPDAGISSITYDDASNILSQTTPLGSITYSYDYNRTTSKVYSNLSENNVYYTYGSTGNETGRIESISDGTGLRTFSYDELGNVVNELRVIALPTDSSVYRFNTEYKYDSWGRMMNITYPDGETVDYNYCLGGDLQSMVGQLNGQEYHYINEINYNVFGQKSNVHYGNGTIVNYTYDRLHRLSRLESFSRDDEVMQNINYTYDALSNITQIINNADLVSGMGGHYQNNYEYDNISRLIQANGATETGNSFDLSNMAYSPSGRLLCKRQNASTSSVDLTYSYSCPNRPHAPTSIRDAQSRLQYDLSWDAAGNLMQINTSSSVDNEWDQSRFQYWTVDNRMYAVSDKDYHSYYAYDHAGERTYKMTGSFVTNSINLEGANSTEVTLNNITMYPSPYIVLSDKDFTKHYYAGAERVCARIGSGLTDVLVDADSLEEKATHLFRSCNNTIHSRVLATEDCSNVVSGAPTVMGDSVYVSLNAFQERMNHLAYGSAELYDDGVFFYHPDHLGSASWVTDGSGMPIQHLQYLPFGEEYISEHTASPYTERFTFTGKERDEETGYTYHGARYFDASLMCSWFSVDPLSDKYPSMSPYNYCAWNPVKLIDPDGREINPVFGTDGSFRGCTKEGYTGEIIIYDGNDDFNDLTVEELYNSHDAAMPYSMEYTKLTDDAKSKIYTHIVSQYEGKDVLGKTFSMNDVHDNKIKYDRTMPGNWCTTYDSKGQLGEGSDIYATDKYLSAYEPTVENIQSSLIFHEWLSHKILGVSDVNGNHQQAYQNVMKSPLWSKTTPNYQEFNQKKFKKYAGR